MSKRAPASACVERGDERGDRARIADRAERERGRDDHLRIAIAERGDERSYARVGSISASDVAAWKRRSAGPSRSASRERLEAVGVADRAERDRGVLADRGRAVVEPLDERGQIARSRRRARRATRTPPRGPRGDRRRARRSSASTARRRSVGSVTSPSAWAAIARAFGLPLARSRSAASNVIVEAGNRYDTQTF